MRINYAIDFFSLLPYILYLYISFDVLCNISFEKKIPEDVHKGGQNM